MSEPESPMGAQDEALGDELPDDLVPAATRGPYSVPDNARRRRPAVVLAVAGAACGLLWLTTRPEPVLANRGTLGAALFFLLAAAWFAASARPVRVWEDEALAVARGAAGFDVRHGRAQLAWRGLLGRPIWRVLLYERAEVTPRRAVFVVDAGDGSIVENLVESVPAESEAQ